MTRPRPETHLPSAVAGDATALDNLGTLYSWGAGVERDAAEAARLYRAAAELGRPAAQYNLGNMYASGEGIAQDQERCGRPCPP